MNSVDSLVYARISHESHAPGALDRNLAAAHAFIGYAKLALDRAEETEAHLLEAFASPLAISSLTSR
jgi:hypothetical protein